MSKILDWLLGEAHNKQHPAPVRDWRHAELESLRQSSSAGDLANWLRHDDGRLREAALARTAEAGMAELYPAVMERLNDWAPQVRQAARSALVTMLALMSESQVLAALGLLERLFLATREDHTQWIEQFEAAALEKIGPQAVLKAITGQQIRTARACFRIARQHRLAPLDTLVKQTLQYAHDIRIAIAAFDLIAEAEQSVQSSLFEAALANKFGAVRTRALRALLAASDQSRARPVAMAALADPYSAARGAAIWHLQQMGVETDRYYLEQLATGALPAKKIRLCLSALCGHGNHGQLAVIKSYLNSPWSSVQVSALLAWARLDKSARDDIVVVALQSEATAPRKIALLMTEKYGACIDTATAVTMSLDKADSGLALAFAQRDPWIWLATIINLWSQAAPAAPLRCTLIEELGKWTARSRHLYQKPASNMQALLTSSASAMALEEMLAGSSSRRQIIMDMLARICGSQP
ncbi:hypothetical protein [Janthinobacterium aquaticum]|uniref:hypothetical protein n=1 Tax=Janthinobacterium sp. FT58W TaxID=2654254 RepID=UPI001264E2DF|nr:hypothetical protein [Janthinobacterium sp. FT58W]KAB8038554.1 hypothetical protein GCM43_22315 [Janthinobacterium sp. FT58W]